MDWKRFELLRKVCRTSMLPVTSSARNFLGKYRRWESNSQPLVSKTSASFLLGYVGKNEMKSRQSDLNRRLTDLQSVAFDRLVMPARIWSARRDSNPQQLDWKSRVQPIELHAPKGLLKEMSGAGLEPAFCRVRSAKVSPINQTARAGSQK